MGTVEIDESELSVLRNAAKFIQQVEAQEGGAKEIQKWAKKINPKIRTEEDIAEEYAKPIKSELEELKNWKKELTGNIDKYNEEQGWEAVRKDYGYTEEGIKSLREFAEKSGIKNPKHAAAAWDKENPATPTKPSYMTDAYSPADMLADSPSKAEEIEKIRKNPNQYEKEQVAKFYEEKRQKNGNWNL